MPQKLGTFFINIRSLLRLCTQGGVRGERIGRRFSSWKKLLGGPSGGRIKDSSVDSRNGWLSGPGRASPAGWIYKFPQLFANLRRHYIAIWGTPTWIDRRVISTNIKPRFAISCLRTSLGGCNPLWIFYEIRLPARFLQNLDEFRNYFSSLLSRSFLLNFACNDETLRIKTIWEWTRRISPDSESYWFNFIFTNSQR